MRMTRAEAASSALRSVLEILPFQAVADAVVFQVNALAAWPRTELPAADRLGL